MSEKKLEDMTFDELSDHIYREVHSALLEGGGKKMKLAIELWMNHTIKWNKEWERRRQKMIY